MTPLPEASEAHEAWLWRTTPACRNHDGLLRQRASLPAQIWTIANPGRFSLHESNEFACRETSMPPWLDPSLLPAYAAALGFGYLCGSIPFGLILTRLAGTADIRAIGSGNIGATNVLRTGHKGLAAATLIADALKGTLAV